jgi:hypothetical protein
MAELQFVQKRQTVPPVTVPGGTSALLTETRKMNCLSWSLPAGKACPAAVYGPGTICGSCYAKDKGRYRMHVVKNAQQQRFDWAVRCMRTPEGVEEYVSTMVDAIGRSADPYFRVDDSGDLFNPTYVRAWTEICKRLPDKRFWIPTRTWRFLDRPQWGPALLELAALPNVTMRPSALRFDDAPPIIPGMAAGTTATTTGFTCLAPSQGNQCLDCRQCWDAPETPVSYHKQGA